MKSKHVKSEMSRGEGAKIPKIEKMAQAKLKKVAKNKDVKINEKVDNTAYRKETLKANNAKGSQKYIPRARKVTKTIYD